MASKRKYPYKHRPKLHIWYEVRRWVYKSFNFNIEGEKSWEWHMMPPWFNSGSFKTKKEALLAARKFRHHPLAIDLGIENTPLLIIKVENRETITSVMRA